VSFSLKTYLKNFVKLDISRVADFPEFPNKDPGTAARILLQSSSVTHGARVRPGLLDMPAQ
jgi:hypothetical protein